MPPPSFHYIKHGRAFGPVSAGDLLGLVEQGVIGPSDLVRVAGLTSWVPAHQVVADVRGGRLDTAPPPATGPVSRAAEVNNTVFTSAPPAMDPLPAPRGPRRKKCIHCGVRTSADAGFCHRCHGDLSARGCGACGGISPPRSNFCGQCGRAL